MDTRRFVDGEIFHIELEILKPFRDGRGHLIELFRKDEIAQRQRRGLPRIEFPPMAYASVTTQGTVRGPHEHLVQSDVFVFMRSKFQVFLWDMRDGSPSRGIRQTFITSLEEYSRLVIPPGIVHAYKALVEGLVLNFPDQLFRGWNKEKPVDEIRHEHDLDTPYVLW